MPKFEIHFHDKVGAQIAYVEHFHAQFDKDMNMQVMDVNGEINKALKELDTDDNEKNKCEPSIGSANDYKVMLSTPRQSILDQLLNLADKGDWVNGKETEHSEILWRLLESGRGDRVKIVWQNIVGYLDDKKLFRQKGSPALNKDFFGDDKGYTNIDKGRPNKGLMTPDFESIIPLLDAYVPKLDKKA